jgi:hypothetical protein
MAAEIAQVGDAETHLTDAPCLTGWIWGIPQVEPPLFPLQRQELGGYPRVLGQTSEVFEYDPDGEGTLGNHMIFPKILICPSTMRATKPPLQFK